MRRDTLVTVTAIGVIAVSGGIMYAATRPSSRPRCRLNARAISALVQSAPAAGSGNELLRRTGTDTTCGSLAEALVAGDDSRVAFELKTANAGERRYDVSASELLRGLPSPTTRPPPGAVRCLEYLYSEFLFKRCAEGVI